MLYSNYGIPFTNTVPRGNEGISQFLICSTEPVGFQPVESLCRAVDPYRGARPLVVYIDRDMVSKKQVFVGIILISFIFTEATMIGREPRAKG